MVLIWMQLTTLKGQFWRNKTCVVKRTLVLKGQLKRKAWIARFTVHGWEKEVMTGCLELLEEDGVGSKDCWEHHTELFHLRPSKPNYQSRFFWQVFILRKGYNSIGFSFAKLLVSKKLRVASSYNINPCNIKSGKIVLCQFFNL